MLIQGITLAVAPLAGGVDRNAYCGKSVGSAEVAPLAGGVDRNGLLAIWLLGGIASPPSRGAWIEI